MKHLLLNKKTFVLLTIFILVVVAVWLLYPVAQNYYQAVRVGQKYQADIKALQEKNNSLREDIAFLNTDEGVKQRAQDKLNVVEPGLSVGKTMDLDTVSQDAMLKDSFQERYLPSNESSAGYEFWDWFFGVK